MNTSTTSRQAVGRAIKGVLAERGIKKIDLAAHLDVSRSTLDSWLNAETAIQWERITAIAAFAGVSATEIVQRAERLTEQAAS